MDEELNIYQKVAQFIVNIKTENPREAVSHALAIGVFSKEDIGLTVEETSDKIQKQWSIKVPLGRIAASLKTLANRGIIGEHGRKYSMDTAQKERYFQAINNRITFFQEVEREWLESMQSLGKCRKLNESEKELVINDLRAAIDFLCNGHALKIANFLRGNTNVLGSTFIGDEIIDYLKKEDSSSRQILAIEKTIFPLFFQIDDLKRAKYITGLAQAFLRRMIFQVEVEGHSVLEGTLRSIYVYLDTNMVFDLLGLHGDGKREIAENIISMHRSLGIRTCVDKRSIREYKAVLGNARKLGIATRIPKGIFREVKKAIKEPQYKPTITFALPNEPFTLMFWASLDESYVEVAKREEIVRQWDRFIGYLESVEIVLSEKYGIEVVNKSKDCNPEKGLMEEACEILEEGAKRYGIKKRQSAIEHDAIMFFLIGDLRSGEKPQCLPSNYWLLSADRSLIYLHKEMIKRGKADLTYSVPLGGWTQLIIPFLTIELIDEKNDAMAIAKSLGVQFEQFEVVRMQPKEMAEVLYRVPETSEDGPELTLRCAGHRHFRETIQKAVEKEKVKKKEVDKAVINAFDAVKDKSTLADKRLLEELERSIKGKQELEKSLVKEKAEKGVVSEELESKKTELVEVKGELESIKGVVRKVILAVILVITAGLTSYGAYAVYKLSSLKFAAEDTIWVIGDILLVFWITMPIIRKKITLRYLLCTFLVILAVFILPLFWIYWSTVYLTIIVPTFISVIGLNIQLVRKSWLDFEV